LKAKNKQNAFQTQYKSNPILFHLLISYFLFYLIYSISSFLLTLLSWVHLSDVRGTKFMVQNSFDSSYFFCSYERNEYDIFQINWV